MSHEHLCEKAKTAIQAIHGDTSVSIEQTLNSLKDLRDEIDILIEAVETDIENA